MKKIFPHCVLFLLFFTVPVPFFGQFMGNDGIKDKKPPQSPVVQQGGDWSHFECVIAPSISTAFVLFGFFEGSLGINSYWERMVSKAAAIVPVYFVNPLDGLGLTVGFGGLVGLGRLMHSETNFGMLNDFAYTWLMEGTMYAAYLGYVNSRIHAAPGIYQNDWRKGLTDFEGDEFIAMPGSVFEKEWKPYGLGELFTAPLDGNHYNDLAMLIIPFAGVIGPLIMYPADKAIWNTGKTYIGNWETPAIASIPIMLLFFYLESTIIAVSEESLFRGFLYEDIAASSGHINAKIFDCIAFPAIHVPQEIEMGYNGGQIALDFLRRAVLTFYLDFLYDRGGLTHTVTAHMLIDFSQMFTLWLMRGGAPQSSVSDLIGTIMPLEFAVRLAF
jgi:membrane protease YdiL (CAAX protease family)